jgi:hypothetical protein
LEHRATFGVTVIKHVIRHTVKPLSTSDQHVAETSTYTGQHKRQTSISRAGFEPAISATKRPRTYAHTARSLGSSKTIIFDQEARKAKELNTFYVKSFQLHLTPSSRISTVSRRYELLVHQCSAVFETREPLSSSVYEHLGVGGTKNQCP